MTTYAYVQNGTVAVCPVPVMSGFTLAECYHPEFVSSCQDVTSLSPQPQPGWVATGTPGAWTFAAPPAPPAPTIAEHAAALLNAGLVITSTGTPALDGTYACDDTTQSRANRIASYVGINGKFPNGAATLDWKDATGATRTFPSVAEFQTWFTAMGNFIASCDDVILGFSTILPAGTVAIA